MRRALAALATLAALALTACQAQAPTFEIQEPLQGPYQLDRITDGDTIRIHTADGSLPVRLIGIDTPETKHPTIGVQPYGPEATEHTTRLLTGKPIYIELDLNPYDRYDRLLAYVYTPDENGSWVAPDGTRYTQANHAIALAGYAQPLTIQPNSRYADIYAAAVNAARDAGRGMWAGH